MSASQAGDSADIGLTADRYTPRLAATLETWLDYCSRMAADELVAVTYGFRAAVAIVLTASDVEAAGFYDALGDVTDEMRRTRVAMDEENAR